MPENALKGLQPPRAGTVKESKQTDGTGQRIQRIQTCCLRPQNLEFTLWLEGLTVPLRTQMVRFYTININQSTYRNILVTI